MRFILVFFCCTISKERLFFIFRRCCQVQQEYIDLIINLIRECHDIELLDFIMQLLQKST